MLPYTATDMIRLVHLELDRDLDRFARLHPNGIPTPQPRRLPTFCFARKRRQS